MKFIEKFKATMKESDKNAFYVGILLGSVLAAFFIDKKFSLGLIVIVQIAAYGYQFIKRKSHVESSNAFATISGANLGAGLIALVYYILTIFFV